MSGLELLLTLLYPALPGQIGARVVLALDGRAAASVVVADAAPPSAT